MVSIDESRWPRQVLKRGKGQSPYVKKYYLFLRKRSRSSMLGIPRACAEDAEEKSSFFCEILFENRKFSLFPTIFRLLIYAIGKSFCTSLFFLFFHLRFIAYV